MGELIRSHDWSTTLGPPEKWPESLKIALRLMLSSGHPMMIWWGPDLIQFYNDAHRRSLPAERHPAALGAPAPAFQPEIREIVGPQVEHVMSGGGATWRENQRVPILRSGRLQETFWTWSYNPIDAPNAPLGVGGIMIICRETTAAVMAERRQSFQLALADCLRDLGDPREVMAAAAELLGRHLGADRVGYSEIDETGEIFTVERDWRAPGAPSLVGARRLNDFGPKLVAALRAGQTVRFEDALTDSLTAGEDVAAAYAAATSRAAITVPLVKSGRFAAAIFAHQRAPRYWTDEDEALVREVAERTWAAVERARAEAALRQSEAHWRGMFDRLHEGFFLAELIRDGNGKAVDWRYIDVNSVWETLTQVPRDRAVGRTIREMHPSALGGWIDLFAQVVETGKSATLTGKGARGNRWYQGQVFRTGPNQFAVLFLDVTERH
jgi:PAS domain-containing protein